MLRRVAKPSIWLIINQEDNNLEFFPLKHIVCTTLVVYIGKINYFYVMCNMNFTFMPGGSSINQIDERGG